MAFRVGIFALLLLLQGCASAYVDYSGQIRDSNGNPIYPTWSQPVLPTGISHTNDVEVQEGQLRLP